MFIAKTYRNLGQKWLFVILSVDPASCIQYVEVYNLSSLESHPRHKLRSLLTLTVWIKFFVFLFVFCSKETNKNLYKSVDYSSWNKKFEIKRTRNKVNASNLESIEFRNFWKFRIRGSENLKIPSPVQSIAFHFAITEFTRMHTFT